MKLPCIVLIISCFQQMNAQDIPVPDVQKDYQEFLERVAKEDSTIRSVYKEYRCSENFLGRIRYYFHNEELHLIEHTYKPGFYDNYHTEYFFLQEEAFALHTEITRIIHLNTQSLQDKYSTSFSAEKVLEVIEKRTFINAARSELTCYQRSHGMKSAAWDQDYFNTIEFDKIPCSQEPEITLDDLTYKYRLLRKAEKKLKNYRNTELQCIFHLW